MADELFVNVNPIGQTTILRRETQVVEWDNAIEEHSRFDAFVEGSRATTPDGSAPYEIQWQGPQISDVTKF